MSPSSADLQKTLQQNLPAVLVRCFEEVGSVMDVAKDMPDGLGLVLANRQTNGRGRHGRSWIGTEGAFLACLVFPLNNKATSDFAPFSLVVAYTIAKVLTDYGLNVGIKWPNDVWSRTKKAKLCGILIEAGKSNADHSSIRVGIGLNLQSSPEYATSVYAELGRHLDYTEFAMKLTEQCCSAFDEFCIKGLKSIREKFEDYDILLGSKIEFTNNNNTFHCDYLGIDEFGQIRLRVGESEKSYSTGQIERITFAS